MTNIYEINDLVDFLDKHQINIRQFLFCMLLHYDKRHSRIEGTANISRSLSKLYQYWQNIEKFKTNEINDLIDKKLLVKHGKRFKPDMLEPTDKFVKSWYGDKYKFQELRDIYPDTMPNFNHPGKPPIRLKLISNYERLQNTYNAFVKNDKMHKRVLELVTWAKETDNLNLGIEKFVNSRYWEELKKLKEKNGSVDNYTLV